MMAPGAALAKKTTHQRVLTLRFAVHASQCRPAVLACGVLLLLLLPLLQEGAEGRNAGAGANQQQWCGGRRRQSDCATLQPHRRPRFARLRLEARQPRRAHALRGTKLSSRQGNGSI